MTRPVGHEFYGTIHLRKGQPRTSGPSLQRAIPGSVVLCSVVLAALLYGAHRSARKQQTCAEPGSGLLFVSSNRCHSDDRAADRIRANFAHTPGQPQYTHRSERPVDRIDCPREGADPCDSQYQRIQPCSGAEGGGLAATIQPQGFPCESSPKSLTADEHFQQCGFRALLRQAHCQSRARVDSIRWETPRHPICPAMWSAAASRSSAM